MTQKAASCPRKTAARRYPWCRWTSVPAHPLDTKPNRLPGGRDCPHSRFVSPVKRGSIALKVERAPLCVTMKAASNRLAETCFAARHLTRSEFGLEQKAGNMRSRWLAEEMGTLLAFPSGVTGDGIGGPADRARMGMGIGADGASSIAASPLTCEPCGGYKRRGCRDGRNMGEMNRKESSSGLLAPATLL